MELQSFSAGIYIVAVSGGVDSVALLHALVGDTTKELVVAHFDHGIRADSASDALFVKQLADTHNLSFESQRVELGEGASEATAREARYAFLNSVKAKYHAKALITAHHQDDVIETALLNTLRGTKRRGLVSLQSGTQIIRPLIDTPKSKIIKYAHDNQLTWREDSTNSNTAYLRNHIRTIIKQSLNADNRAKIINMLEEIKQHNHAIDECVYQILNNQVPKEINKKLINNMQLAEAYEIAAAWLRINRINFDENTIKRLVIGARTLQNSANIDLKDNHFCVVKRDKIVIERRSSV